MMRALLRIVVIALALAACATWQPPPGVDDTALRERMLTETARDVSVGAVLLDAQTSEAMFGTGIAKADVQPVWLEVENRTSQPLWLLRTGTDPAYFSPLEVAWSMHRALSSRYNARVDDHVSRLAFPNPILPGATNTGVIFTNPQRGTVLINLDLFGERTLVSFSLIRWRDAQGVEISSPVAFQYPRPDTTEYADLVAFRNALEQLPGFATHADGTQGAPLNLVVVGSVADLAAAAVRRNYRRDFRDDDKLQRVFGRAPDSVWRKQAKPGAPATWIRLWSAPIYFDGKLVLLAQVGRPVGGRFAADDATTRSVHGDVDEARNLVVQDMMYSGGLDRLGYVAGVGAVADRRYHTDGLRAVLFITTRPLGLSDVELLDWAPIFDRDAVEQGANGHE